uniref:MYM-type domain-containing protein n=1 Tax=viral metagenome TaxID=1070528 RepID=A0A6C0IXB8_9ZZZZ
MSDSNPISDSKETTKSNIENQSEIKVPKKRGRKPKPKPNIELEVKIPKKRGRKPKPKPEVEEVKIPKKRGRKPKPKPEVEEVKVPKKRGRKYKQKSYQLVDKVTDITSKNVILHLPIKSKNIYQTSKEQELLTYKPDMNEPVGFQDIIGGNPIDSVQFLNKKNIINKNELGYYSYYPFDQKKSEKTEISKLSLEDDLLSENSEFSIKSDINSDDSEDNEKKKSTVILNDDFKFIHNENWYINKEVDKSKVYNNVIDIMKEERKQELVNLTKQNKVNSVEDTLIQFNSSNSWISSTSVYCWWCCHPFSNIPCAIPYEYIDKTFKVYGVFCSPECAAAYIFDNYNNNDVWEKYSLLNFMYSKLYNEKNIKIKLAPPRQTLKIFGGSLYIKHFRENNTNYKKDYKIINPPMVSIIPQQEYNFINKGYSYKDTKKYVNSNDESDTESLVLKRSKPFIESNNTLEKCMNLKVN